MNRTTSSTSQLIHLAWPVLVAQLAVMANAVIDTAMAGLRRWAHPNED
jgi:MATE family multidrug resistance protein